MSRFIQTMVTFALTLAWQVAAHAASTELGSGVWLDDDAGALIVGAPGQPLIAYNPDNGSVLWRSGTVARPVLIAGDYVVAFENAERPGRLRLIAVGKRDGKRIARSVAALPNGVLASVAADAKSRFQLRPHPGFRTSRMIWEFTPSATSDTGERALAQSGVLSIDARTARAGALDETPPPRAAPSARLNIAFAGSTDPAFFSADREHVIVSRRLPDTRRFEWALHDRDARLLGRIEADVTYAPFVVRGDLLVSLHASAGGWRAKDNTAQVLRTADFRRAEIKWERNLSPKPSK